LLPLRRFSRPIRPYLAWGCVFLRLHGLPGGNDGVVPHITQCPRQGR
jgi:hypothetical protein